MLALRAFRLRESQWAMVGARAKDVYAVEAKERQRGGQGGKLFSENVREAKGEASEHACEAVSVSARSVEHAIKVLAKGSEALVDAVDHVGTNWPFVVIRHPRSGLQDENSSPFL